MCRAKSLDRLNPIRGRFHTTADHLKAILCHLLLAWRTVNPIADRLSLAQAAAETDALVALAGGVRGHHRR
jgi:hypothetical protein